MFPSIMPKFTVAVITVAAGALTLAACGGSGSSSTSASSAAASSSAAAPTSAAPASSDAASPAAPGADAAIAALVPADIKEDGTLTVGMEVAYPPFGYMDTDNVTPIGFDVDIAKKMTELMGLGLDIQNAKFDSIIPSLLSNRYEIGISAFSVTEERAKQVDFITYFESGDAGVVMAGNPNGLALDTTICGAKVGVLKGSTQESVTIPALTKECETAGKPAMEILAIDASDQMPIALQSGRADIILVDSGNAAYIANVSEGKFAVAEGPLLNSGPGGMIVNKGSKLADAVSAALQKMIDDGTYASIAEQWNLTSGEVAEAVITR